MLAEVNNVSSDEAIELIGLLVVIACLVAAGVAAWRSLWVAAGGLVVVAIVAAFLLL